jgi:lipopolysaccharide export system permease protein
VKIIDRYLLRQFLVPLAYCFAAFTMVYVIFDLFNNLTDFIQGQTPLLSVLRFYLMMVPASLTYIMPVSLLLAVLWSLSGLTKNNELTAMRACGVSMGRLMAPLAAVGLVAALMVTAVNETVGSYAAYWTRQFVRAQLREDKMGVYVYGPLAYHNQTSRRTWMIHRYNTLTHEMQNVEVIQHDARGMDAYKILAPRATRIDGRWWFEDLKHQVYDEFGHPRGAPRSEALREMAEMTELPEDFANEVKEPEFLSAAELIKFIRTHPQMSRDAVQRFMVDFHSRLALPWGCLIAVLFGIPFGNMTGRKGALRGVLLCVLMFFSSWVLVSIGLWAGKKGFLAPWIAGWGPILVYLGIGTRMAARIR